jgi:hypothetical protein
MIRHPASRGMLLAIGLFLLAAGRADAHGLEPALLALREVMTGRYEVVWKSSKLRLPGAQVRPILPDACRRTADPPQALDDGDRLRLSWVVDCGAGGLAGQTIGVGDLDIAKIDALLHVRRLDGAEVQTVLTARQSTWTAPVDPTRGDLVRHYARLGAARVLGGLDRLLFVCGLLVLLAPAPRRLLQAILACAIGYSLALSLTAVGVVAVPTRAVEILLAAGVLLLAVEMARGPGRRLHPGRTAATAALAFGLLSGCAFAVDLAAAGLPDIDAPLAMLAFNLGIALTQLGVGVALLALGIAATRLVPGVLAPATRLAAYGTGILAAFWCFERLAA